MNRADVPNGRGNRSAEISKLLLRLIPDLVTDFNTEPTMLWAPIAAG